MDNSDNYLENQLCNVNNARASEDQILWTISGLFGAINAILLVALFPDGKIPKDSEISLVICFVGLIVSITWLFLQRRALAHIYYHEELRVKIERKLKIRRKYSISPELNHRLYEKHLDFKPKARDTIKFFVWITIILWAMAFIFFTLDYFDFCLT